MKLGFSLPVSGAWATPQNQIRIARHAEALGYDSLWVLQRLMYPLQPKNDYPPMAGQPWPKAFERVADPVVTLAYVAGATEGIRLGTAALIMPYYMPIVLAKMLTSLDIVSGGRLDVGLAPGWSVDEYAAVGAPYRERGKRADEFLRCLKAIWTDQIVEFEGDFYRVPRAKVEPKPVQRPHPPILIGGYGPAAVERAARLGDGFVGGNVPLGQVTSLIAELKSRAEAAERDPDSLRIVGRGVYRVCDSVQGPQRRPLWGTFEEVRDDIKRYEEAGLTELFLEANVDPTGVVLEPDPSAAVERTLSVMTALAPTPIQAGTPLAPVGRVESPVTAGSSAGQLTVGGAEALLLVFANPPVGDEDAFNDWYDEHAAARLGVPGVLNARRYQAVAEDGPRYMASYDLDTVETLQRSEYVRLNAERSARERDMLARLRMLDRRVLKLVLGTDAWTEDAPYQFAVGLEPSAGAEEDLIAWCREEHIPLLLQVPGWRRVRLFQQVEGSGPAFVALHEVESPAVFQSEAYRHSISTAWRDRIMGSLSRQEQHLFKLLRSFPLPTWGAA